MEFVVLGDADSGPTLDLDHRQFAYAGKFVMSSTGKLVAREQGELRGAVSFSPDRSRDDCAWLRYLTVHTDYRGHGIGPRLAISATTYLHDRGFNQVRIGVNNAFAYYALYRAGFGWTGKTTGLAELVLTHPQTRDERRFAAGLQEFQDRSSISDEEEAFIHQHLDAGLPPIIDPPD